MKTSARCWWDSCCALLHKVKVSNFNVLHWHKISNRNIIFISKKLTSPKYNLPHPNRFLGVSLPCSFFHPLKVFKLHAHALRLSLFIFCTNASLPVCAAQFSREMPTRLLQLKLVEKLPKLVFCGMAIVRIAQLCYTTPMQHIPPNKP